MKKLLTVILTMCLVFSIYALYKLNPESVSSLKGSHFGTVNKEAVNVTCDDILAEPERYNGKLVRVIGYGYFHGEGHVVYPDENPTNQVNNHYIPVEYNELELDITKEELYGFDGKLILIEGTYDTSKLNWGGVLPGGITNISRIDLWEGKLWR